MTQQRYVTDEAGNRVAVLLEIDEYERIQVADSLPSLSLERLAPSRLHAFAWDGKHYSLKEPLDYTLTFDGEIWVYRVPKLSIYVGAPSLQEAYAELQEEFAGLVSGLLNEPDENLTIDGMELRDQLRACLAEVTG